MSNAALAELRDMGGSEFVRDLVETFATNVAACVARVHVGLGAGGDKADAAKAAHSIAGGAGQLGEAGLEAIARELELALRSGKPIDASRLTALSLEGERAVAALRDAARE